MLSALKNLPTKIIFKLFFFLVYVLIVVLIWDLGPWQWYYQMTRKNKRAPEEHNEFLCHYKKTKDDTLKSIDHNVVFPKKSIFFIESSCRGLTSRQACSVEAAAKANPDRQINVLFTSPISWDDFKKSGMSTLLAIDNVEAARIHIENYARRTPIYEKLRKKPLTRDDINVDLAEILKYVTMYKYSGVYLSLDVIVTRSFNDLTDNWVVKEAPASISSSMFALSDNKHGRAMAEIALDIIHKDLSAPSRQDFWSFDNSNVMKQLVSLWCSTTDILYLVSNMCQDLEVLPSDQFFPVSLHERQKYFEPVNWEKFKHQNVYTYQIWDRFTKYNLITKQSLYGKIAQEYCPIIYEFYGDNFGIR